MGRVYLPGRSEKCLKFSLNLHENSWQVQDVAGARANRGKNRRQVAYREGRRESATNHPPSVEG